MLGVAQNLRHPSGARKTAVDNGAEIERYFGAAERLVGLLCDADDVTPRNHAVNKALGSFRDATLQIRSPELIAEIVAQPEFADTAAELRDLMQDVREEREKFCARAILGLEASVDRQYASYATLPSQPYQTQLIGNELEALGWPLKRPPIKPLEQSIAFVGAGALPIGPVLLYLRTGLRVTCVEPDPQACDLGRRIIRHLAATEPRCADLEAKVTYRNEHGPTCDYITHPIVFIANRVIGKDAVMMRVSESCNTASTILLRSTEGLGAMLYAPYEPPGGMEFYNIYLIRKRSGQGRLLHTAQVFRMPPGKLFARNKLPPPGYRGGVGGFGPSHCATTIAPKPKRRWRTGSRDHVI